MGGGLLGYGDSAQISNSYATGNVSGGQSADVGGLIGVAQNGTFESSYSTGAVSGGEYSYVGGYMGDGIQFEIQDCYWDTTTSGTSDGIGDGGQTGLTGLTTEQLQAGLPKGFKKKIWAESGSINNGFPYLRENAPDKN